jgi:concanavalin A-like lectin/glucanase superfamily protein
VLSFGQGNGVSLTPTSGVVPNDTYTIVMLCSLQTTSGYRRLIDFKNAGSDNGLYTQYGHLYLYPAGWGSPVSIAANTWVQVVVTRDTTGTVTGYVDGVQQFQFSDTGSLGVINSNTLRFFRDDGGSSESSAGSVARIRLYNGALSSTQVAALSRLP